MIRISLTLDDEGIVRDVDSQGHAARSGFFTRFFPAAARWNAVCSAVSTLEYSFLYSVQALSGAETDNEIGKGVFKLSLNKITDTQVLKTLSDSLVIGLDAVSRSYPELVSIDINNKG